ncbi:hypothetical protein H8M03_03620 [Sphingomonas sabuli]|uniref:PilZ domain-containing protein n=2 Tax=Sphingomonas sabuli TaxID=2764186 RepID=A0A7G9L487_9SPHN|nr:hypothetical protein H8M03_03620 [Sphingomonas sabuli]
MLPARMRSASGWSDACILNISPRGLLVYSTGGAKPGSFVEIRRGTQLVVARVVWRQNQRMGLSSTDPFRVEDIISNEVAAAAVQATTRMAERRVIPRTADDNRLRARAFEFLCIAAFAVALTGSVVFYAYEVMAAPLAAVRAALAGH